MKPLTPWERVRVGLASWIMGSAWSRLCDIGWCPKGIHDRRERLKRTWADDTRAARGWE